MFPKVRSDIAQQEQVLDELDLSFAERTKWEGSRDGAVIIALASRRVRAASGLSRLLVLYSAPRGFSPVFSIFPSPQRSTFPNSNSIGFRTSLKTTFG